ncbi:MAG: S1 RNA-binding domain-containing protein [Thermoleophilia bacterium]|nr:S1 RNA-binding domain-containing protein [Thermoleophilia bacterium]
MLDVYGGAARLWWPDVSAESDPHEHPLLFVWNEADARRVVERIVAAVGGQMRKAGEERLAVGEIVEVVVGDLMPYGAFVTLESGRKGLVHVSELTDQYVSHPCEVVEPGDVYRAAVLWDDDRGLALSFTRQPTDVAETEVTEAQAEIGRLRNENRALAEDRRDALEELRRTKDRVRELERRLRDQRLSTPPRGGRRLTEDEFLDMIRSSYEDRYHGDDATRYPLRSVRVGREFMERLRTLDGVPIEKVVAVCADVAAGRVHEIPGRETHQLKTGEGGAPARVRQADGAGAWRCALQRGTPSARRLHWWELPSGGVELASVGLHDDFSIPE